MSGSASIDLERQMLAHTLAIAPMPTLARVYVALCQTAPTEAAGGSELAGGGYARTAATFTLLSVPANAASNAAAVDFAPATADWRPISHFELWTAATGGTRLYWGQLLDPTDGAPIEIDVLSGSAVRFSPGSLVVQAAEITAAVGGTPWLPTAGGEMTGPLVFTPAGSTTTRSLQAWSADVANVLNFGADPTGAADSAPAINAALATGKPTWLPKGTYLVRSAINVGSGGVLYGSGRGITTIVVDQTFAPGDLGVIVLAGVEDQAPIVSDLRIVFTQPLDQASRANFKTLAAGGTSGPGGTGIKYPPGIYSNNSGRWKLERLRLDAAWDGIYVGASGQPGFITEIEMGALNCGLFVGQARDFFHVSHYHFWAFGLTAGNPPIQNGVYFDGNTVAIDLGSIGGVNGANMTDICLQAKLKIDGGGSTWAHITNLMMDGPNSHIDITSGQWVQITNCYSVGAISSGAAVGRARINHAGGSLFLHNFFTSTVGVPSIAQTGGVVRVHGAQMLNATVSVPTITSSGGGHLEVQGAVFGVNVASGAWTVPIVNFTSSGVCTFQNNVIREASPGDVGALVIATDNAAHLVSGNGWQNWKWTPPGVAGQYGFNGTLVSSTQLHLKALPGRDTALTLHTDTGHQRSISMTTAGVLRWSVIVDASAESGSSAGSDFSIVRANDAGTIINAPIAISRASGGVTMSNGLTIAAGGLGVTGNMGFNGAARTGKPTVSGAKGGNAALASLLTALATYGLITDSST